MYRESFRGDVVAARTLTDSADFALGWISPAQRQELVVDCARGSLKARCSHSRKRRGHDHDHLVMRAERF